MPPRKKRPSQADTAPRLTLAQPAGAKEPAPLSPLARRLLRGIVDALCAALGTENAFVALPTDRRGDDDGWSLAFSSGLFANDGAIPPAEVLATLAASAEPLDLRASRDGALIGGSVALPDGRRAAVAALIGPEAKPSLSARAAVAFALDACAAALVADHAAERQRDEQAARPAEVELAGGVAHEINNPLTVILGKAEGLRRSIASGEFDLKEMAADLAKIEATASRIARIVSALKQLARKDIELETQPTSVARLLEDVRDVAQERFRAAGVELRVAEFPAALTLEAHPTLLGQAILNLVNNGFDAIAESDPNAGAEANARGLERWVQIDWAEGVDSIYLYVTDGGPGIPIRIRNRIFDPFFTTKGSAQGTGLGLSLAASIVARHHGALRLDPLSARTRFVVQLPRAARGTSKIKKSEAA